MGAKERAAALKRLETRFEFYLNARREEMQADMRELLRQLDGSRAARVAMLACTTREELEAVGGAEEDDWRWPSPTLRCPARTSAGGAACRHAAGPTRRRADTPPKISIHLSSLTR